jgi:hypothetical protein
MSCIGMLRVFFSFFVREFSVFCLKGLSAMDLDFDDMYDIVLGLNRGRGHFLNFLGSPMIYNAKSIFLISHC